MQNLEWLASLHASNVHRLALLCEKLPAMDLLIQRFQKIVDADPRWACIPNITSHEWVPEPAGSLVRHIKVREYKFGSMLEVQQSWYSKGTHSLRADLSPWKVRLFQVGQQWLWTWTFHECLATERDVPKLLSLLFNTVITSVITPLEAQSWPPVEDKPSVPEYIKHTFWSSVMPLFRVPHRVIQHMTDKSDAKSQVLEPGFPSFASTYTTGQEIFSMAASRCRCDIHDLVITTLFNFMFAMLSNHAELSAWLRLGRSAAFYRLTRGELEEEALMPYIHKTKEQALRLWCHTDNVEKLTLQTLAQTPPSMAKTLFGMSCQKPTFSYASVDLGDVPLLWSEGNAVVGVWYSTPPPVLDELNGFSFVLCNYFGHMRVCWTSFQGRSGVEHKLDTLLMQCTHLSFRR